MIDAVGEQHLLGGHAAGAGLGDRARRPARAAAKPSSMMWSVMKRPEPPRRLGGVRPGRSPGDAGRRTSAPAPSARARRRRRPRSASPRRRSPARPRRPARRPGRRDRPQDWVSCQCVSVLLRHFSSPRAAPPSQSRAGSSPLLGGPGRRIRQRTRSPARVRGTHERCAVLTVDEIHHDLPIAQFIGRKGQLLEGFGRIRRASGSAPGRAIPTEVAFTSRSTAAAAGAADGLAGGRAPALSGEVGDELPAPARDGGSRPRRGRRRPASSA